MSFLSRCVGPLLCAALLSGVFATPAFCQSAFDDMVPYVPENANAVFMINAEKIFQSPVAKAGNWQAQRGKRFDSGLTALPAAATRVMVGSHLDLETMRPQADAAIVEYGKAPSLSDMKQHFGGVDDTIGTTPALRVADDAYVVRLTNQMVAAFGPANRQMVTSWLSSKNSQLSPYLEQALRYEDEGTEVIMAIDATNALTPAFVEQRLAATDNPAIKNAKITAQQIAEIVSSLKGLMLGITFGDKPYGKIRVDFGKDATPLTEIAKPLVLTALANHGALIEEMEDWKAQVKGNTIYLDGYLEESGLTRIASLINLPTRALHAPAGAAQAQSTASASPPGPVASGKEQVVVETTQQYFKAIDHLLNDLRGQKGEARTIGQIGLWFQKYADRVNRLPLLNVDPEMLKYGDYVAQQLRNCSMAIKGYGINKRVAEESADVNARPFGGAIGNMASNYYASGAYTGGYYGRPLGLPAAYGWARRVGPQGVATGAMKTEMAQAFSARTAADVQLKAGTASSVQGIMEQLREAHQKVREDMTEKYKVEF
jgi:hypothetical protein